MNKHIYNELITKIRTTKKSILVIGDLMLDQYIFGEINRISPEAPVPILKAKKIENRLGGAGNVANNLINLGVQTTLIGAVGNDTNGESFLNILKTKKIKSNLVFKKSDQTTTKVRSIASGQQLIRQDFDSNSISLNKNDEQKILNQITKNISIIILSDYAKGFLSFDLCQKIIQKANKIGVKVIADTKTSNMDKYRESFAITPNSKEALVFTGIDNNDSKHEKHLIQLMQKNHIDNLIVTNGEQGISLFTSKSKKQFPAISPKQVFDVSGAGDTVIATIAAALHAGLDMETSIQLANLTAGIVIQKIGTEAINLNDLESYIFEKDLNGNHEKIFSAEKIIEVVKVLKKNHKSIGFTNGCFDILHSGHVTYLAEAKKQVDFLILALNTDRSIKKIKGPLRPIVDEQNRAKVLAGLSSIDAVVFFDENTPIKLIQLIQPNLLIKGNDYKVSEVVGHKEIKKWRGEVRLIELIPGQSSSNIIKKINQSES